MLEFCAIMPNRFGGNEMLEVYVLVEKEKSIMMKNNLRSVLISNMMSLLCVLEY